MSFVFINDNMVVRIEDEMTLLEASEISYKYQLVIDSSSMLRQPKVGWVFDKGIVRPNIPSVTPRQIRQAMILSGISLLSIESALDNLPDPQRSLAKTEWEYSVAFDRYRGLVSSVGAMLGYNDDQLDALWLLAGSLK